MFIVLVVLCLIVDIYEIVWFTARELSYIIVCNHLYKIKQFE